MSLWLMWDATRSLFHVRVKFIVPVHADHPSPAGQDPKNCLGENPVSLRGFFVAEISSSTLNYVPAVLYPLFLPRIRGFRVAT